MIDRDGTLLRHGVGVIQTQAGGRRVLMTDDLHYYALDGTAEVIWDLLDVPRSRAELVGLLTSRYAVSADTCAEDLHPFLDALVRSGALAEGAARP